MEIKLKEITIQEIVRYSDHLKECQGYNDKGEEGVYGMNGRLNIRPIYQREFIYKDKQRNAVIDTVVHNYPLNVMYFVVNKDGSYEVLDGQQRLISLCQYVSNRFSIDGIGFKNLKEDQQENILNYKLMVYFCEGTESEKLVWFKTINIAGEKLTDQELLNAVYSGKWISDSKRYFSKTGCPAYRKAEKYLKGVPIRQDYLETVLSWVSRGKIEYYMSEHQHDDDAFDLWEYFNNVISWVEKIFPKYRREMKGIPFGKLYNDFKQNNYNYEEVEKEVSRLMMDEDVERKTGIYIYIFTRDEKYLGIRNFSDSHKREVYEKQNGICVHCGKECSIDEMEADHITPWSKGGPTSIDNCQMLCVHCNRTKSSK